MKLPEGYNKVHWTDDTDTDVDADDEERIGFGSKSNNDSKINNQNIDVGENRNSEYLESNNNVILNYFIMNKLCCIFTSFRSIFLNPFFLFTYFFSVQTLYIKLIKTKREKSSDSSGCIPKRTGYST